MTDLGWGTTTTPTPTPAPGSTPVPHADAGARGEPAAQRQLRQRAGGTSGTSGRVTGNNVNGTRETGEPSHSPDRNAGGASIWYRWTAPGTGRATFNTTGSSFDTILAIYSGTAVNALTPLVSGKNDDASSTVVTSSITVDVVAGTTYSIAVDGYNNNTGAATGAVVANWTFTPGVPANNNFASAQIIAGSSGRVTGSNVNATKETGEPSTPATWAASR